MNAQSNVSYEEHNTSQDIPVRVIEHRPHATLMQQERFWATLVHALGPITVFFMLVADVGLAWVGLIFITAGVYLYYQDKSALVQRHARQALAAQLIGTVGWGLAIALGAMAWVVLLLVSIVLILVLIGLILTPVVALAGPLVFLASFSLPLGVAIFGAIGAWETWHGNDFRYPYLADWLDERFGKPTATATKQNVPVV